jgi:hypothetical protein
MTYSQSPHGKAERGDSQGLISRKIFRSKSRSGVTPVTARSSPTVETYIKRSKNAENRYRQIQQFAIQKAVAVVKNATGRISSLCFPLPPAASLCALNNSFERTQS